jgi:hypothetical protein
MTMKFLIGNQPVEAQVVSEGTIISEKSDTTLRKLTISFTLTGIDVGNQYKAMILKAKADGISSEGSDQEELILWEVYDLGPTWRQVGESPTQYEVLWELTEKEAV